MGPFGIQPVTGYLRGLWFSGEVAHYGKSVVSVFQGFFASIGKIFNLAGGLGAGVSFYGDWALS